MVRRFASQVHKQASRLMGANLIKKEPAWYKAVLEHPPLPLPAKAPPPRTNYDLPHKKSLLQGKNTQALNPRPQEIVYKEDRIRKQFFQDHPYEAFRPVSLVENATIEPEHPIRGVQWKRLAQRGRNPTPDDAIRYAVNLHEAHGLSLTNAYQAAVAQFRSLRSEHLFASKIALMEAEHYGIEFGPSEMEKQHAKETRALQTWQKKAELDQAEFAARKRWKAIVGREGEPHGWTRGENYVRLWKEGVRPTYAPQITAPVLTPTGLEEVPRSADDITAFIPVASR
ncbi:mitochondrial ribosomal protein S25-domain-containing protein [Abortiporus biennis]|nr:mitochondrial ribosomal protein S25-domain-containing protein [Abortiporus biennis]